MESVKHVFGALLIAVAIYLLGALPQVPVLLLWGVFFIMSGVYLRATAARGHSWKHLQTGLGIVLFIWGIAALIGGFTGNRNVVEPLSDLRLANVAARSDEPAKRVRQLADLEARLAHAKASATPVLIDYYADWCADCVRMEATTFLDARVQQALRRVTKIQVDIGDERDPQVQALKKRFSVFGPPALLFIDANGVERRELRSYGYRSADELLASLQQL